jgi:hypothetical protein
VVTGARFAGGLALVNDGTQAVITAQAAATIRSLIADLAAGAAEGAERAAPGPVEVFAMF